jgi:hypothetical protein
MRVHHNMVFCTTYLCAFMANPDYLVYKVWQHNVMHELAHAQPYVVGGFARRSLTMSTPVIPPFASSLYELGLHLFVDASLGTPRADRCGRRRYVPGVCWHK